MSLGNIRPAIIPLLIGALTAVVCRAEEEGPPIGPAPGIYEAKLRDPVTNVLINRGVRVELPSEFRITQYKRLRVMIRSQDLVIHEAKPSHEKKLRDTLADPKRLEEEFFSGLLSSGPLWISPPKPDSTTGVLTAEVNLTAIDCRKAMNTYTVYAFPAVIPIPVKQSFGALNFSVTVREGDSIRLKYNGFVLLNLSDPGPKASLRSGVHFAGDWLGQLFRAVWKGEQLTSAGKPPAPIAAPVSAPAAPSPGPAPPPSEAVPPAPEPASSTPGARPEVAPESASAPTKS